MSLLQKQKGEARECQPGDQRSEDENQVHRNGAIGIQLREKRIANRV